MMSVSFTPKKFSKRLSRSSYISSISEATEQFHEISLSPQASRYPTPRVNSFQNTFENNTIQEPSAATFAEDEFNCLYCQESDLNCLVECDTCKNKFCNSGIKDSSHIYIHSKFMGHNKFNLLNYESADISAIDLEDNIESNNGSLDQENGKLERRFKSTPMKCCNCNNSNIYELSFVIIDNVSKELVNMKDDYSVLDEKPNVEKKVIFFCTNTLPGSKLAKDCLEQMQVSIFGGLEIEQEFIRPIINVYDVFNKFGFKKFFFNRLLIADNSERNTKVVYGQVNLSKIYSIERLRLKQVKTEILKKTDIYNMVDEIDDYQFYDSSDETEFEEDELFEAAVTTKTNEEPLRITSPLLNEERELLQNKTRSLRKINKLESEKKSVYENFLQFATHNLNLMFKEQFSMLSLSTTMHKLSTNLVYVPYKKITFIAQANKDEPDVTVRLNTNYSLPLLRINQVIGFQQSESKRIMFALIKEIPQNSFNPDIKLKIMKFGNGSFNIEDCFLTTDDPKAKQTFTWNHEVTNYHEFALLPFDIVFSRIIVVIFKLLTREIKLNNFLTNLILGKNFENFEFNLTSFKNDNVYPANFNLSQKRAIDNLDSNKVIVVKGDVGTGKTLLSATMIDNLISKDLKPVLVCSGSNLAVDNLCQVFNDKFVKNSSDREILITRLIAPLKESQYNISHSLASVCFHNFILSNAPEELINLFIKNKIDPNSLSPKNQDRLSKFYRDFFSQQDVVFTSCYNAFDPKLDNVQFKSIVIDDCSTTMNLLTLIPLARNCEKLVLIGDDKQFSPYISDTSNEIKILKQSLFQRVFYNRLVKPIVLTEQYRMSSKLAQFPNYFIYNDELTDGMTSRPKRISSLNLRLLEQSENKIITNVEKYPIIFWDHAKSTSYQESQIQYHKKINNIENFVINQVTFQNHFEAQKIVELLKILKFEMNVDFKDIGVLTPYVGQRALIASLVSEEFAALNESNANNKKRVSARRHSRRQSFGGSRNSSKYQNLGVTSNEFLFENHNPGEFELSTIEKVKQLEIGSIDSFQGKEKDYIILSTVKSNKIDNANIEELKILDDYRRLNVAITRSKYKLIIIGDSRNLSYISKHWTNYLSYLYELDLVVDGSLPNLKSSYKEYLTYLKR